MAKYLLLKHYRGAPAPVNDVPMDQWAPDEVDAHVQFMLDFAARLERTGEFVDTQALSPDGVWARCRFQSAGASKEKTDRAGSPYYVHKLAEGYEPPAHPLSFYLGLRCPANQRHPRCPDIEQ